MKVALNIAVLITFAAFSLSIGLDEQAEGSLFIVVNGTLLVAAVVARGLYFLELVWLARSKGRRNGQRPSRTTTETR
jgi:hypothetical protein